MPNANTSQDTLSNENQHTEARETARRLRDRFATATGRTPARRTTARTTATTPDVPTHPGPLRACVDHGLDCDTCEQSECPRFPGNHAGPNALPSGAVEIAERHHAERRTAANRATRAEARRTADRCATCPDRTTCGQHPDTCNRTEPDPEPDSALRSRCHNGILLSDVTAEHCAGCNDSGCTDRATAPRHAGPVDPRAHCARRLNGSDDCIYTTRPRPSDCVNDRQSCRYLNVQTLLRELRENGAILQ